MSVVGFDIGNENCIVAVARQRGIDVVLNEESKRETPAVVCFGEKQRFIGTAGAASLMMNPKNSVSQIKRLIGRKFSDPELQRDLQSLPFTVTEGLDGFPLIHARYLGEERTFTPTQVLAMVLSNLKSIAEKNLNTSVVDCCIGIPVYFIDLQRRAVMEAAAIAGLHPLRLFHETTATALAYGIYKTDLPENDQLNVAFVDVGHADMQVCIAGFKKGQLKILSHWFDPSIGGSNLDEVLFKHFAAEFKAPARRIDVGYQNAWEPCLQLRQFLFMMVFPIPLLCLGKDSFLIQIVEQQITNRILSYFPRETHFLVSKLLDPVDRATFSVDVMYTNIGRFAIPRMISTYTVSLEHCLLYASDLLSLAIAYMVLMSAQQLKANAVERQKQQQDKLCLPYAQPALLSADFEKKGSSFSVTVKMLKMPASQVLRRGLYLMAEMRDPLEFPNSSTRPRVPGIGIPSGACDTLPSSTGHPERSAGLKDPTPAFLTGRILAFSCPFFLGCAACR
ncbi:hypothetical protein J5N97_000575 [Dioscorea zingiberensis]|uniref:Uncharacterized protein n=1 Tax=Dioscorea zingiberensis TaxID=325984 RepID=A0A9D5BS57_9LILI|nr:hypothetical protein J5N97_000575 [Dioscorea zingiberensis]